METVVDVALIVAGIVVIYVVMDAAIRTFVVPRGAVVTFTLLIFRAVRKILNIFTRRSRTYEARDRIMALYAPLSLLALPALSLLVIFGAYALIYEGIGRHGWAEAFTVSGSSLLTLGFDRPHDLPSTFVAFSEAAIGLGLLALVIAYLPTIYTGFSRREVAVTDLAVRAGTPPSPPEMIVRAHLTGFLEELDPFWESWIGWFSEIGETHTSIGSLSFFRSPNPHRSWITASGAVLDAASLRLAVVNIPKTPAPALCIRSGYLALREIAGFFGFEYNADPAPDDPISIARDEFDEVCARMEAAGVPLVSDRDQAWRDFAGWRVNYDQVLHALAGFLSAPYAPWISDRSPRLPARYYAWGRQRVAIARRTPPPRTQPPQPH